MAPTNQQFRHHTVDSTSDPDNELQGFFFSTIGNPTFTAYWEGKNTSPNQISSANQSQIANLTGFHCD